MADRRLSAEGEDRGRFIGKRSCGKVTDQVDAAVDRAKPSIGDPACDLVSANALRDELPAAHGSVLKVSERANDRICRSRSELCRHTRYNPAASCNAPLLRPPKAALRDSKWRGGLQGRGE